MKKNEMIYRAIGGISEEKAADAYLYTSEKQKNYRLRAVFSGVGIAAIVCSFFVLSFVLLKVSGPKTDPASSGEGVSDALTNTENGTASERILDQNDPSAVIPDTEKLKIDELYKMEPYKDFIPVTIPNLFTNFDVDIIVPGEYKQNNGKSRYVDEEWNIYIGAPDSNGKDTNWLDITIKKLDEKEAENVVDADKLSTSLIKNSRVLYSDPYGNRTWKLMLRYSVTFKADGCEIIYRYTKLSGEITDKSSPVNPTADDYAALDAESQLSPEYLFEMITSAPYFKDHPVSLDEKNENGNKKSFSADDTGVALTLEFNSDRYDFLSVIELTAKLKNTTDHAVTIIVPVNAPEHNSHQEIQIGIYKANNETVRFKDMDTYNVPFDLGESYMTLKPGEEYVQKMRFTGDIEAFNSVPQGAVERIGVYTVSARVMFADGNGSPSGEFVYNFDINIG